MIMVVTRAEQKHNYEAIRKYSVSWGKRLKVEAIETGNYVSHTWILLFVRIQR
jgi:hypothetical protein